MGIVEGKVAIVTGGTRGIGFTIVREFLKNGAKVALAGSRQETVDAAIAKLAEEGFTDNVMGIAAVHEYGGRLCLCHSFVSR